MIMIDKSAVPDSPAQPLEESDSRYARPVVVLLMIAYALSFLDRQILNLLGQSIKTDLRLTDVQLSYLQGIFFALFYTFLGIPLGIAADRWKRSRIISIGVLLWSSMTACCGLAHSFGVLAVARLGVGVGEASLGPSAVSLISDSFSPSRRPRALSIFNMGTAIGGGVAYFGGALLIPHHDVTLPLLGEIKPWQATFLMLGIPGVILSAVLWRIPEPARRGVIRLPGTAGAFPLRDALAFARPRARAFGFFFAGLTMLAFIAYGSLSQTAIFFIRTFGWTARQVGFSYGLVTLSTAVPATIFAGWLASKQRRQGRPEGTFRTIAIGATCLIAPAIFAWLMPNPYAALVAMAGQTFFVAMSMNIATAALADITPNQFRGQFVAAYLFTITIIGLGLGPTLVAMLTEYVFRDEASIRYSLTVFNAIVAPTAAAFLWFGMPDFKRGAIEAESWTS